MNESGREADVRRSFDSLSTVDVDAIHEASLHILAEMGIQLQHDRARDLLVANGASVHDDNVVTIPPDLVAACIEQVPGSFTLHARNPERSVQVGGDSDTVRAPGYGPTTVRTFEDGRREATLADYEDLVKLAQVEDVITCAGFNLCEPTDIPQQGRRAEMLRRSLHLSDKPVMGSTQGAAAARVSLELAGIALDDPDLTRPSIMGLINTVPPRGISEEMLGALLAYAEYGQPLVISSFTMAGASGPAGLAASMAQANAENLTGITIAQLVTPGTPVVYGIPSSNIDAEHGTLTIGSPESALFVSFAGQMGRYYDIPSRAGGGLTDGKTIDYQSGIESMFMQFATAGSDIDFVLNAVGTLESYAAVSPEKFVLDCEALRYLDRFQQGVSVDETGFPFELMAERGPAGHFLDESGDALSSDVESSPFDKTSFAEWNDNGAASAFEAAHSRVQAQLAQYERPDIDPRIARRLEEYTVDGTPGTA